MVVKGELSSFAFDLKQISPLIILIWDGINFDCTKPTGISIGKKHINHMHNFPSSALPHQLVLGTLTKRKSWLFHSHIIYIISQSYID